MLIQERANLVLNRAAAELREILHADVALNYYVTSFDEIKKLVYKDFELDSSALYSRSRKGKYTDARHVFIWFLHRWLSKSHSEISRLLGMHHTTIMYAVNRIDNVVLYGVDGLCDRVERIGEAIRAKKAK